MKSSMKSPMKSSDTFGPRRHSKIIELEGILKLGHALVVHKDWFGCVKNSLNC